MRSDIPQIQVPPLFTCIRHNQDTYHLYQKYMRAQPLTSGTVSAQISHISLKVRPMSEAHHLLRWFHSINREEHLSWYTCIPFYGFSHHFKISIFRLTGCKKHWESTVVLLWRAHTAEDDHVRSRVKGKHSCGIWYVNLNFITVKTLVICLYKGVSRQNQDNVGLDSVN